MVCVTKAAGTRPTSLIGTRPLARAFRPGDRTWRRSISGCMRNSSSAPHMETKSERWAERKIWRKPRRITPRPAPSRRRDGGRHFCKRPNRDRAINIGVRQFLQWRSPGALRHSAHGNPGPSQGLPPDYRATSRPYPPKRRVNRPYVSRPRVHDSARGGVAFLKHRRWSLWKRSPNDCTSCRLIETLYMRRIRHANEMFLKGVHQAPVARQ